MSLRIVGNLNVYEKDGVEWKRMKVWWGKMLRMEIGWSEGKEKEIWINAGGLRYEGKVKFVGKVKVEEEKKVVNVEF